MSERDLLALVLDEALKLAAPAVEAGRSAHDLRRAFAGAGWDLDAVAGLDVGLLGDAVGEVVSVLEGLIALTDGRPLDFAAIAGLLGDVADAMQAVDALAETLGEPLELSDDDVGALAVDILDFLVVTYLQRHHPLVLQVLVMLALADPPDLAGPARLEARPGRIPTRRPRLALHRLPDLLSDPVAVLRERWLPADAQGRRGLESQEAADLLADRLFPQLAILGRALGARAVYGTPMAAEGAFGVFASARMAHALTVLGTVPLPIGPGDSAPLADEAALGAALEVGATVLLSGRAGGDGMGVVVLPHGEAHVDVALSRWHLSLELGTATTPGEPPLGFAFDGSGVSLLPGASPGFRAALGVRRISEPGRPAVVLGSESTRLQIGGVAAEVGGRFGADGVSPWVEADLLDARIVVVPGDGDTFLRAVLPPEGLQVPFELGARWATGEGLTFRGGASLEVALPVGVDLGFLKIPVVNLSLGISEEGLALGLAATADLTLGPIAASIERMGVALELGPERPGAAMVGPVGVRLRFLPPKGIGMGVDAGPVSGGGYIFLDPDAGEYAGLLHLEIGPVSATAVGLLQTRLPGGVDGFSLVTLISAGFPPIQLGYGFTLNGLGGLLGINRAVDLDALRDGVRSGALGSLLFPEDPVPRARQIIADVGAIFPPAEGQFVIGPMVKLGWGTPTLISATLAVVIQFPTFVVAILGRIQVALPEEGESAVLLLRIDVVGIVDPGRGEVSVDGSLTGSRVAAFAIEGDFAMRLRVGPDPVFALSVGGFHPRFTPPPGFPALRRLAIALSAGDNPVLRLEAYTAITPATLQFGARAYLYAAVDLGLVGFFELEAELGFDVLVRFAPFGFEASLGAHVAIRRNGAVFAGVDLRATLTGPSPWEVTGRATVKVAFVEATVRVHHRIGGEAPQPPPPAVPLADLARTALGDPGNWRAVLPAHDPGVGVREAAPGEQRLLVHPLGALEVRQTVAPLDIALERAGEGRIEGPTTLRLDGVTTGAGAALPTTPTSDMFAPGQFFAMTEAERLTRPAFESFRSGAVVGVDHIETGAAVGFAPGFEDIVIDAPDAPAVRVQRAPLSALTMYHSLAATPAARGRQAALARFDGPPLGVGVREARWQVSVAADAATVAPTAPSVATFATAAEARIAGGGAGAIITPADAGRDAP
ncbi:MAG: hypothetical protein RIB67_03585 [Miltoncostaeaceae bacterium]